MKRSAVTVGASLATLIAAACGGGGETNNTGAAAAAVAQYFVQERAGGRLPQGTDVRGLGIETNNVVTLDVSDDDRARDVSERFCMQYRYQDRANAYKDHWRVYVAELINGAWAVESVNPDGSCEGVV